MTLEPRLNYKGIDFWQVGCAKCCIYPQKWDICFNLDAKKFIAICRNCGHIIELTFENVKTEPDLSEGEMEE